MRDLRVFALEDTSVQLTWSGMRSTHAEVGVGPSARRIEASRPVWLHQPILPDHRTGHLLGGPGAVVIDGLSPATTYDVWVAPAGSPPSSRRVVGRVTTLDPPPGQLLARFASVSDTHVGEWSFGLGRRIREGPELGGPSSLICLTAAVAEAGAWGAELIVARGDLTRSARAEQFHGAAQALAGGGMPALSVLGNHDVRRGAGDVAACVAACATAGVEVTHDVAVRDLPGLRLVLVHSPRADDHRGALPPDRVARVAEACAGTGAGDGVAVILHHPPDIRRWAHAYPPGLPWEQGRRLAAELRAAHPAVMILAGHRHRCRRYCVGGVTVAELGSTRDYPGVWAGYAVYEGGIRQVVRRVGAPAALAWTEATGGGMAGTWRHWSPGSLDDRCWVQTW